MEKSNRPTKLLHTTCMVHSAGYEWASLEKSELLPGHFRSALAAAKWTIEQRDYIIHNPSETAGPLLAAYEPDGDREFYDPIGTRGLLERFLRLPYTLETEAEWPKQYRAFAGRFGLLGEVQLQFTCPKVGSRMGESINYWREQICMLTRLDRIYQLLKGKATGEAADELEQYVYNIEGNARLTNTVFHYEKIVSRGFPESFFGTAGCRDLSGARSEVIRENARVALHAELNSVAAALLSPSIDPFGTHVTLVASNLLGAIYVQFIYKMLGQQRPIKFCACDGCLEVVQRQRSSAKYCSETCQEKQKENLRLSRQATSKNAANKPD